MWSYRRARSEAERQVGTDGIRGILLHVVIIFPRAPLEPTSNRGGTIIQRHRMQGIDWHESMQMVRKLC